MAVVSLKDVHVNFGGAPLFDGIELHLQEGDRLVVLGRNGEGKSTLLRVIAGTQLVDSGSVAISNDAQVAMLDQDAPLDFAGTALEYCMQGTGEVACRRFLTQLGMDGEAAFSGLSGGGRRRVMLAAALAAEPDVLLLDEPTNHLDIDTNMWLEEYLRKNAKTLVMITHDRAFARAVANRVAELDRGELFCFDCGYDTFLQRREAILDAEQQQRAAFDKKLAAEEAWLRRGVKARRTRDEGRVKALMQMREQFRQRRSRQGSVKMAAEEAVRSGNLVAEVEGLVFSYPAGGDAPAVGPVINGLTTTIMRGDRVGIVGPNGAGKTTLVRLLLGQLKPCEGTVRLGTKLEPLYYDQLRSTLDPNKTVIENLTGGDDVLIVGGRQKHANAYLQDFLFSPERARNPVRILSGGERNRLLLAKLFAQPSNLLVLDEPTNDLDVETLDLLEDMLLKYSGTVLLVSHDREFLDNVVTDCLVFTPDGRIQEFVGGYSDWRERFGRQGGAGLSAKGGAGKSDTGKPGSGKGEAPAPKTDRPRKLGFNEKRELAEMPDLIAGLEKEIAELHEQLADPELYRQDGQKVAGITDRLSASEQSLETAFARWEELEALAD
ncbi:MAG: ATP-binding cassette domain-containing protein [Spirochaetaceae bacterium]|nr:MAG: ATP-binding cassette domain-containing protein [Spirochaetaceae bacterium]